MNKKLKLKPQTVKIPVNIKAMVHAAPENKWDKFKNSLLRKLEYIGLISRGQLEKWYIHGELQRTYRHHNLIATVGLDVMAAVLTGDYPDTGAINVMSLGDGTNSVNEADTQLENELYRNPKASSTHADGVAILTAFFTESEVDGSFTEFGNFIDGDYLVANDGILWSHISGVDWEKSDMETLTVQCTYDFANAA